MCIWVHFGGLCLEIDSPRFRVVLQPVIKDRVGRTHTQAGDSCPLYTFDLAYSTDLYPVCAVPTVVLFAVLTLCPNVGNCFITNSFALHEVRWVPRTR